LVRLLPEGEIKVKLLENHWVEIVSDKKKYKTGGYGKENFPALPVMPHTLVRIPAAILETLLGNEIRNLPGGVALHVEWRPADPEAGHAGDGGDGRPPLGARGTDHKLSGLNGEVKVLVPKKAMGRSRKTFQRCRCGCADRVCERTKAISFSRSAIAC